LTGSRYLGVVLVLKLLERDLGWSLLTGGRYSEVDISTGLTVLKIEEGKFYLKVFFENEFWDENNNNISCSSDSSN
jgi:hypothetical protein